MNTVSTPTSPQAAPARRRGPGRPRAGSEDKRVRILNEAVVLFGEHGYAGTSLADIANAADISKAGLLHHFSSKDELFAKVLERRDREDALSILVESPAVEDNVVDVPVDTVGNVDTLEVAAAPDVDVDPWALLDRYIELLERNVAHRDLTAIYTATAVSVLDAAHPAHRWMADHLNGAVERFESSFEAGKAAGLVDPQMPSRLVARSLVALTDGLQLQWLCSTTPETAASEALGTDLVAEIRLYADCLRSQWELQETPETPQRPKAA
ncbi:helix-turn-helix domain-containing protein [uncultured Actinomyces sp.]|uniref:TetR/AcrR family transcriptional regulator n=1 Tax=uncultured Actinomyces sp. TaxID=249061 RepID=UPI0028D50870|nr:helix-turn-helix domain-containing protein [uncultured Actinomyces sp.]